MAIDFAKLLSTETRTRLARTSETVERLYRLPDRWLAEELLRLARACVMVIPSDLPIRLRLPTILILSGILYLKSRSDSALPA